jgi:hypothetical protein
LVRIRRLVLLVLHPRRSFTGDDDYQSVAILA